MRSKVENSRFCGFHTSLLEKDNKQIKIHRWAYCVCPKQEHTHYSYEEFPKKEYQEYQHWCEDPYSELFGDRKRYYSSSDEDEEE